MRIGHGYDVHRFEEGRALTNALMYLMNTRVTATFWGLASSISGKP